jgi:hypothetical protein
VLKKHISLPGKPSMFKAQSSSTLHPDENAEGFWKEFFLPIIVFKMEKGLYCSKWAYSAHYKKHIYLSKETMYVRSRRV